jgi:hypothetical protein
VSLVAILVGVFGAYAGWHWKLLHRGFQAAARAKGELAAARKARWHHMPKAVLFAIAALIILVLLAKVSS